MERDWRCGSRAFLASAMPCLLFSCLSGLVLASPVLRDATVYADESAGKPALTNEDLAALSHVKCNVTTIDIPDPVGAKQMLDSAHGLKKSRKHSKDEAMRIYNGALATDKNWFPQVVALMHVPAGGHKAETPFCTGSLLDAHIVLSAAHCLNGPITGSMIACVGAVDTEVSLGTCGVVTKAEVAPGYADGTLGLNDLMILVLDRSIIADGVKRIKMSFSEVAHGAPTVSVGYGYNTPGIHAVDGKLRFLDSRAVKGDQCRVLTGQDAQLKYDMICSDGNYDGTRGVICSGDSGGPLILSGDVPENHVQIGVASFVSVNSETRDCDPAYEGAYVNTWSARNRAFIETEVVANGGTVLLAGSDNAPAGTCQDQVNACVRGVDLKCGMVVPITTDCCGALHPRLQCVQRVANACGDVGLAGRMKEGLDRLNAACTNHFF